PEPVKDFSRQVEVVVGGRLRETAKGQGELAISLWNKTDAPVAGPIMVVIEETGLEQVQVGSHDVETAKGKPLFELVPAGKVLLPGGMTAAFPIAFSMPEGLSRDDANKLHLATRVFARNGLTDEQRLQRERDAQEEADFATSGKSYTQADLNAAIALQQKVTPEILKKPDTIATAITEDDKGKLALRVYTETRAAAKSLPGSYGDLKVDVKPVPGGFKAGPSLTTVTKRAGEAYSSSKATRDKAASPKGTNKELLVTPVNPQQRFERPVPIGVSSFNGDTAVCASGTLGARVKDNSGKLYAISNTHVWGDHGQATIGQRAVQPSQGDNNCVADQANNTIGLLADFTAYQNSNTSSTYFRTGITMNFIDAALVEVVNSTDSQGNTVPAIGFATPSDGYGAPSSKVLNQNRIGLQVQKYGRTTGYTRGFTSATNVAGPIAGNTNVDDTNWYRMDEYTGLLQYGALGAPGDSGSLIVTLADRRPVSMLFGGGSLNPATGQTLAVGNRITWVLSRFNVKIDDGTDPNVHVDGTGNIGLSGRGALAFGNLSRQDLDDFLNSSQVTTTPPGGTPVTVTQIINQLLPPELRSRIRPNRPRLNPVTEGTAFP
ncbi:MAG TPA: hypothetical protein VM510_16845, partial [Caulifigura sp.]|nr:hypothetical protein [Caulifigura sp.]